MRKIVIILILALVLPGAFTEYTLAATSGSLLDNLRFGQALEAGMICIKGPCSFEPDEIDLHRPFNVYQRSVDSTHYGEVQISAPEYSYFEGELFQLSFKVLCSEEKAELCLESLLDRLEAGNGLREIKDRWIGLGYGDVFWERAFLTDAGDRVEIHRKRIENRWEPPRVKIYNPGLMRSVRLEMNPFYDQE